MDVQQNVSLAAELRAAVEQLSWRERLALAQHILATLEKEPEPQPEPKQPLRSLRGLWKDFNITITEEDIAEARKEMWGNFGERDI